MFILYGEEYAPQYIASDPANKDLDMVDREFELPNSVKLTGIDLDPLIKYCGFQLGDRLLCCVRDWDKGSINIAVVHDRDFVFNQGFTGSARIHWYQTLESCLLASFASVGPNSCIEEQLASIFFEHSAELCIPACGSIEEYLTHYAKKVGVEHFGVETRLWHKGQDVPAVGPWNRDDLDSMASKDPNDPRSSFTYTLTPEIVDQYVLNMLFHRKESVEDLVKAIYPEDYVFQKQEKSCIVEELSDRECYFRGTYNWFADQDAGRVREKALELFSKVNYLVYQVDCTGDSVKAVPQQELVILTQLYSHLLRIIQNLCDADELRHLGNEVDSLMLSLEGMKWNFEEIRGVLEAAVEEQRCRRFKVIKIHPKAEKVLS